MAPVAARITADTTQADRVPRATRPRALAGALAGERWLMASLGRAKEVLPGLTLCAGIAATATSLHHLPALDLISPMIIAIMIGMSLRAVSSLAIPGGGLGWAAAGERVAARHLLRLAIALLGLRLTLDQVTEVGVGGVAVIAAALVATFVFTTWLGARLGVSARLTQLIAAGTSICGASAVIAANTVTRADDEDVAYAVACVSLFGTVAMLTYPMMAAPLRLSGEAFGLWAGASIHEVAQVVAAAFQGGQVAGEHATIAKLTRVVMLAPVVLALGSLARRSDAATPNDGARAAPPMIPWFVIGFVAMVVVNSTVTIPPTMLNTVNTLTGFALTMALGALGMAADPRRLWARGWRPAALGLAASLFISGFSLILVLSLP